MGKKNNAWNHYFRDKNRFADLFNGVFFDGEGMIVPEELETISEVYEQATDKRKRKRGLRDQRSRDIKMVMKSGEMFRLLALENQDKVNYAMPFRCMQYDTMEYSHQLNHLQKKNMKSADYQNTAERMGRFKKTDRLTPVYTLCLYHGEEPWDGPRCLKDMMEFGDDKDRMSMFFADYPMRLFCVNEQEDFGKFQSEIRKVFRLLKFRKDKRQLEKEMATNEEYRKVDIETLEVLSVMLDALEIPEKEQAEYLKML